MALRVRKGAQYLTQVSTSASIETCITIRVRILLTIVVLSILAYSLLIAALCAAFHEVKCSCDHGEGDDC